MQSFISVIILWMLLISLCVQTRSIDKIEPVTEDEMSQQPKNDNQRFSKQYLKLLADLKRQESTNSDDDSNDLSSSSTEKEQKQLPKRAFFLFPRRRSNQRYRPIYTYGRKSHWDTFFG